MEKMIKCRKLIFKSNSQYLRGFQKLQLRNLNEKKKPCDMISSADPISNLHHIKYAVPENETPLERKLREKREELQEFNEMFWTKHNSSFIQKKLEFEKKALSKKNSENRILSADEISVFYKQFLDENWEKNLKYLLKWYKSTFYVTFLHIRVKLQKLMRKM